MYVSNCLISKLKAVLTEDDHGGVCLHGHGLSVVVLVDGQTGDGQLRVAGLYLQSEVRGGVPAPAFGPLWSDAGVDSAIDRRAVHGPPELRRQIGILGGAAEGHAVVLASLRRPGDGHGRRRI